MLQVLGQITDDAGLLGEKPSQSEKLVCPKVKLMGLIPLDAAE